MSPSRIDSIPLVSSKLITNIMFSIYRTPLTLGLYILIIVTDYRYCPETGLALPSYVSDMVEMTHGLRSSGSTFMYLYHLISIDLELSRSFNSHTAKSYSYEPG